MMMRVELEPQPTSHTFPRMQNHMLKPRTLSAPAKDAVTQRRGTPLPTDCQPSGPDITETINPAVAHCNDNAAMRLPVSISSYTYAQFLFRIL